MDGRELWKRALHWISADIKRAQTSSTKEPIASQTSTPKEAAVPLSGTSEPSESPEKHVQVGLKIAVITAVFLILEFVIFGLVPIVVDGVEVWHRFVAGLPVLGGYLTALSMTAKESWQRYRFTKWRAICVVAALVVTAVIVGATTVYLADKRERTRGMAVTTGETSVAISTAQSATSSPGGAIVSDTSCDPVNPSDKQIPDYELCVTAWCYTRVLFPNGAIDRSQTGIKLHPRITNNSQKPLDISITKPSALRLLVRSSDLPYVWEPPPETAAAGDAPFTVTYLGQTYWAIPPNLHRDLTYPPGAREIGFVTWWNGLDVLPPNSILPPPTSYRPDGTAIQQGDLVFHVPEKTLTNGATVIGLALLNKKTREVLALARFEDWGQRKNPNDF